MMLEGIVTNVNGIRRLRQHGRIRNRLVHVSELADKFVKDPRELAKASNIVEGPREGR